MTKGNPRLICIILKIHLEDGLNHASPPNGIPLKIRRYYVRCWRYINAYAEDLDVSGAQEVVRKFTEAKFSSRGIVFF
jgi:hypothetical protein